MNEKTSALYSEYVIDGVPQELTPAHILEACMAADAARPESPDGAFEPIVDETVDPAPKPCDTDPSKVGEYLRLIKGIKAPAFPSAFPETYTKSRIACALIGGISVWGTLRSASTGPGVLSASETWRLFTPPSLQLPTTSIPWA